MTLKSIIPRAAAEWDIDAALAYYRAQNARRAAFGFIDALAQAYAHISQSPASGSPRYAHDLNIPGLRFWPLRRYPYLVFYVERDDHIDVWRLLHGQSDIPASMATEN